MYRRKRAGDNLSPYDESRKNFIYEHHVKAEDIRVSLVIGRNTLKPGVVTGISDVINPSKIKPRKLQKKRCLPATNESTDNDDSYLEKKLESNSSNDLLPVTQAETKPHRTKSMGKKVDNLKEKK